MATIIALALYGGSFLGVTVDRVPLLVLIFFGLFMADVVLLVFTKPSEMFKRPESTQWPCWAKWVARLVTLAFVAHFVALVALAGWGSPEITDGMYVIVARGHILREITKSEYMSLKAAELRVFSTLFIAAFVPMAFEWRVTRDLATRTNLCE